MSIHRDQSSAHLLAEYPACMDFARLRSGCKDLTLSSEQPSHCDIHGIRTQRGTAIDQLPARRPARSSANKGAKALCLVGGICGSSVSHLRWKVRLSRGRRTQCEIARIRLFVIRSQLLRTSLPVPVNATPLIACCTLLLRVAAPMLCNNALDGGPGQGLAP